MRVLPEVSDALADGRPVVALESTIISHGLPRPDNLRVAREIEAAVRSGGAVPATIAILGGEPHIWLDDAALQHIALAYLDGRAGTLPFWRMATAPLESLRVRAEAVTRIVAGCAVVDTNAAAAIVTQVVGIEDQLIRRDAVHFERSRSRHVRRARYLTRHVFRDSRRRRRGDVDVVQFDSAR